MGQTVGQTDQGTWGDNGENEGDSPFAGIEEILKAVYKQEYTAEHLKRFRIMLVDDAKIFHDAEFVKCFRSIIRFGRICCQDTLRDLIFFVKFERIHHTQMCEFGLDSTFKL